MTHHLHQVSVQDSPVPPLGRGALGTPRPSPFHLQEDRSRLEKNKGVPLCRNPVPWFPLQCPETPPHDPRRHWAAKYTQAERCPPLTSALVGFGDRQQSGQL